MRISDWSSYVCSSDLIIAMAAHANTCVNPQLMLGNAVMNEQSLSGLRRELLILLAARLDGAQYVWSQHRVIAEKLGATSAMAKAIAEIDLATAALDEPEQALVGFGKEVIERWNLKDEGLWRCRRRAGWGKRWSGMLSLGGVRCITQQKHRN